jgi:crotonobetainyl-CoA:carnitine CoA-transferase CaiB-like acyl-CoA transferase
VSGQPPARGVLSGVRVLEFASYITGPYAGQLLADLGADVIKIEEPRRGDPFRQYGDDLYGPHYRAFNRGKHSVAIDLRRPEAREVVDRLVGECDVLIENFRVGVADSLGIGWERVRTLNPRLVYCAITGMGKDGPGAQRPVYDTVGIGITGLASLLMDPEHPQISGPAFADSLTGMFGCYGVLGALLARERTGEGQRIEVNMLSATLGFLLDPAAWFFTTGEVPGPLTRARSAQAYAFTCADGKAFGIHLSTPAKFWEGLAEAAGRSELRTDPRFATWEARKQHYEALRRTLQETFATQPRAHWLARLETLDVPYAPINNIEEALADPQVKHLGLETVLHHPTRGPVRSIASPITFESTVTPVLGAPPDLGEQTDSVLKRLGYEQAAIDRLRAAGVIR